MERLLPFRLVVSPFRELWMIVTTAVLILAGAVPGFSQEEKVVVESFGEGPGGREVKLYLMLPPNGKAKRVIALCMPGNQDFENEFRNRSTRFGYLIDMARKRNFAVMGFGIPGFGWERTVNSSDLSAAAAAEQDRKVNDLTREWMKAARRMMTKYDLPREGWLIYGACGGAQFAHRLALREPGMFHAVHAHYGGSYDRPTPQAKSVLWLITTRADQPVYVRAQKFYRECVDSGYRMILKGVRMDGREALAREGAGEARLSLQELSKRFFTFALDHPDPLNARAAYVADYVNDFVIAAGEATWVPKDQAIWLPTKELAEAWGPIQE